MDVIPLLLFTGAIFFLMILGPMRKQKKEKTFLTALKIGDRVVTKADFMVKLLK